MAFVFFYSRENWGIDPLIPIFLSAFLDKTLVEFFVISNSYSGKRFLPLLF
jgi:hypothetical protein